MNTELLTVKEYATILGISEQAVYKRIKSDKAGVKPFVIKKDGKTFLMPEVLNDDARATAKAMEEQKPAPDVTDSRLVKVLEEQIKAQKEEIDFLRGQITELTASLKAEQTLHASSIQQLEAPKQRRLNWFRSWK